MVSCSYSSSTPSPRHHRRHLDEDDDVDIDMNEDEDDVALERMLQEAQRLALQMRSEVVSQKQQHQQQGTSGSKAGGGGGGNDCCEEEEEQEDGFDHYGGGKNCDAAANNFLPVPKTLTFDPSQCEEPSVTSESQDGHHGFAYYASSSPSSGNGYNRSSLRHQHLAEEENETAAAAERNNSNNKSIVSSSSSSGAANSSSSVKSVDAAIQAVREMERALQQQLMESSSRISYGDDGDLPDVTPASPDSPRRDRKANPYDATSAPSSETSSTAEAPFDERPERTPSKTKNSAATTPPQKQQQRPSETNITWEKMDISGVNETDEDYVPLQDYTTPSPKKKLSQQHRDVNGGDSGDVQWVQIDSPMKGEDDYASLADYSDLNRNAVNGVGGRNLSRTRSYRSRIRKRRRKLAIRAAALVAVVALLSSAYYWYYTYLRNSHNGDNIIVNDDGETTIPSPEQEEPEAIVDDIANVAVIGDDAGLLTFGIDNDNMSCRDHIFGDDGAQQHQEEKEEEQELVGEEVAESTLATESLMKTTGPLSAQLLRDPCEVAFSAFFSPICRAKMMTRNNKNNGGGVSSM